MPARPQVEDWSKVALKAIVAAALSAAVIVVLAFPIVSHLAKPGPSGALALETRWDLVAGLAVAAAVFSVLSGLFAANGRAYAARRPARLTRTEAGPYRETLGNMAPWIGLIALLLYPPFVVATTGWGGAIKWVDNFGVQILIYVMLAWGLNIVVGLAGLLDLGFIAFAAVGAYSYTLISIHVLPDLAPGLLPFAFWICLPLAAVLASFAGVLLAFPVLRLRGDYLAIVTLAFGEMIRLVLVNWNSLTNGYAGLNAPRITFFGIPFASRTGETTFAEVFGLSLSPTILRAIFLYYVILALALLTAWVTIRLRRMPIGRAWEALREDEIACRALGLNTVTIKLSAFAIGAAFAGMAGAFFATRQGFINPKSFEFMESATVLAIVVLGGMGSLTGCAIAAMVMIGGTELLRELEWLKLVFGRDFDPTQYRMLLLGLALVVLMIWRPRGLVTSRDPSIALKRRKAVSAALVKEGAG
ncbi:MAG: high-affinity branched-chain amino acid ABC transporter permease LivM [Verrucomicrobiae bacterium]|nr:high-affinity branched-chain amino acid ABC transporter permease LivM [Verrucomicrobiae bacterium]